MLAAYKAEQVANWLLEENNHIIVELRKNPGGPTKGQPDDVLDYNFICERHEEMAGLMVEYYSQFKSSQALKVDYRLKDLRFLNI